ncbi:MAG: hypothetical protein AAB227_07710 [Pseudomonadota bacterium]
MSVAEFFDRYWWAVFLFLIFMGTVAFKPVPRRRPRRGGAASDGAGDADCSGDGDGGGD